MDFGESVYILNNIFTSLHLVRKCYEVILSSLTWYSDFLFDFSIIRTLDGKVLHNINIQQQCLAVTGVKITSMCINQINKQMSELLPELFLLLSQL